jgi:hypothetical protein
MMPLRCLLFISFAAHASTIVHTSIELHPFLGGQITVIDSCSDPSSCVSNGIASVATASAGAEGQGYSAHAYAFSDINGTVALADASLDEWLTFTGNVLYSTGPVFNSENFQQAVVTVDAPQYTGDLAQVAQYALAAWWIQPGVPVHVTIQAAARAENWTFSDYAIVAATTIAPEPGTILLALSGGLKSWESRGLRLTALRPKVEWSVDF